MKIKLIILGILIFAIFVALQFNIFRGILEIIIIAVSIYFGIALKNKFGKVGEVEKSTPSRYPEEFMQQNKNR
jgi:hypothetical protein